MSIYVYEHAGRQIEREFPIGKAPQAVTEDGVCYQRVLLPPVVAMADHVSGRDVRFVANSLDPKLYRHHTGAFVKSHGSKVPAFSSKREIREFERRAADAGTPIKYGAGADSYRKRG